MRKRYFGATMLTLAVFTSGCTDTENESASPQQEENVLEETSIPLENKEKVTLSNAPYSGLLHEAYTQMIMSIYPVLHIDKALEADPKLYHFEYADFIFKLPENVDRYDIENDGTSVHISQNGHYLLSISATYEPDMYSPKGFWTSFEENGDELTVFAETALVYFEEDRIEEVEQQKLEILNSIQESGFVFNYKLYADEEYMISLEPLRQLLAGNWQTTNEQMPYNRIVFKEDGTATLTKPTGETIEADMEFVFVGEMMMVHFKEQDEFVSLRDTYLSLQLFDVTEDQIISTIYNVEGVEEGTYFMATRNGEPAKTSSPDLLLLAYEAALPNGDLETIQQLSTKEAFKSIKDDGFFKRIAAGDGTLKKLSVLKKRIYSATEVAYFFAVELNGQQDSFNIDVEWTNDGWKIVRFKR